MYHANRAINHLKKPQNLILIVLAVVLGYLIIVPLFSILADTFTVHLPEVRRIRGSVAGDFTTYHWRMVFASAGSWNLLYEPLINTMVCSLGPCAVSIVLGGGFAWFITRSDIRWKKTLSALCIFPYIMPSWTLALFWLNFFKNAKIGGSPGFFTALTGLSTPDWFAYGPVPIIIVTGLHYAPFAYILIGGILRNMDANLEEAAMLLHASRAKILWRITIPMVMPAILSTFLLVFSSSMSSFAVPAFLGLPVRYQVLTTQLFRTLNGMNPGYGYIIAFLMMLFGTLVLFMNQRLIGTRKSYATVTGKSANVSLVKLRGWRTPISVFTLASLLLTSVAPLLSFAVESLITVPGDYSLANMSLTFWIGQGDPTIANSEPGILLNPSIYAGLWNSVLLSVVCSLAAGSIGFLAGYAIVRCRGTRLSDIVNSLSFFPYLMPSMALSAVYLSLFAVQRGPIPALYGSFFLLALVGTVKYLPFASRAGINSMLQLGKEIEEAATIIGVGWWKRMTRIIVPIQSSAVISGYLLPFISCMRELSLFILLVTPGARMLTTLLFQYNEKGWDQYANAINLIIILIVLLVNFTINKVTGASIDKGIGG
jgi:iron(III) transport system permease protein